MIRRPGVMKHYDIPEVPDHVGTTFYKRIWGKWLKGTSRRYLKGFFGLREKSFENFCVVLVKTFVKIKIPLM